MKDLKLNEQEIAINNFLKERNISFSAITVAELQTEENWQFDRYLVSFERNGKITSFDYKCGTGHRMASKFSPVKKPDTHKPVRIASKKLQDKSMAIKYSYGLEYPNQWLILPTAASVLHSTSLDAQCASDTFEDFCSNLGYDEDSRKALEIYLACQEGGKKLRKIFTSAEIEQIQEILQDY